MTTDARATLDAKLAAIARAVEDARTFEHEHGLTSRTTRKLAASTLHSLRRWQQTAASSADGDTVKRVVGDGAAVRAASADTQKSTPSAPEELPVPVSPVTSIRIPAELRAEAEAFGRDRRWTLGEVTRVALEQLVGDQETHDNQPAERPA